MRHATFSFQFILSSCLVFIDSVAKLDTRIASIKAFSQRGATWTTWKMFSWWVEPKVSSQYTTGTLYHIWPFKFDVFPALLMLNLNKGRGPNTQKKGTWKEGVKQREKLTEWSQGFDRTMMPLEMFSFSQTEHRSFCSEIRAEEMKKLG